MVGLSEDVERRTALLGIAIQDAMQVVGREAIGEGLRARPVVDVQEGVVGKGETDPEVVRQIADSRRSGSVAQKEILSFPSHSRRPAACR